MVPVGHISKLASSGDPRRGQAPRPPAGVYAGDGRLEDAASPANQTASGHTLAHLQVKQHHIVH